jgi:hypothetical protein
MPRRGLSPPLTAPNSAAQVGQARVCVKLASAMQLIFVTELLAGCMIVWGCVKLASAMQPISCCEIAHAELATTPISIG